MSSNKPDMPKALSLASVAVRMKQARVNGDKAYATSTVEPFPWVCANSACRAEYMREPYASEYCPQCNGYLKAGRGDLLDPVMYARCQAIIAQERAGERAAEGRVDPAARDKASGAAAWRALLGLPPLKSDFDVDATEDFKGLNKVVGVVLVGHKKRGTGRKGR